MKVTEDTAKYVAELAKLTISSDEIKSLTKDMNDIVSYFEKLNELDTREIQPKEHVIPMFNVFREDKVENSTSRDEILKNAPKVEGNAVRVPRIVE